MALTDSGAARAGANPDSADSRSHNPAQNPAQSSDQALDRPPRHQNRRAEAGVNRGAIELGSIGMVQTQHCASSKRLDPTNPYMDPRWLLDGPLIRSCMLVHPDAKTRIPDAMITPVMHLQEILRAVQSTLGDSVCLVMVFGSCAQGTARPDSDLDIAVDAGEVMSASVRMALTGALAQATGRVVDLVDLRKVGEPLLGQILTYGKRIAGSDRIQAQYLTRHLMDVADFVPLQQRILQQRRAAWIGQ